MDDELSKELDLVILMLQEGSKEERQTRYPSGREAGRSLRETASAGIVLLRVAAVVLLMLGCGRLIDSALAPPFAAMASLEVRDLHLLDRDASSDELAAMHAYLYNKNWQEVVRRADWYLSVYQDDAGRRSASMAKSAALLMGARRDMLGFGVHFDQSMVDSALQVLRGIRTEKAGPVEMEQAAWFEAKALLMRGDPAGARSRLLSIVAQGGHCVQEARALLSELDAQR
jgi:hypothetical protein